MTEETDKMTSVTIHEDWAKAVKTLATRLNNLINGGSGNLVKCATLRKYADLMEYADDPKYRQFITDWERPTLAPADLLTVERVLNWIRTTEYYTNDSTRKHYMNRFDNAKMRSEVNHVPSFTLKDPYVNESVV